MFCRWHLYCARNDLSFGECWNVRLYHQHLQIVQVVTEPNLRGLGVEVSFQKCLWSSRTMVRPSGMFSVVHQVHEFRCIKLADGSYDFMQGDNDYTAQAWDWLEQNELAPYTAQKDLRYEEQQGSRERHFSAKRQFRAVYPLALATGIALVTLHFAATDLSSSAREIKHGDYFKRIWKSMKTKDRDITKLSVSLCCHTASTCPIGFWHHTRQVS